MWRVFFATTSTRLRPGMKNELEVLVTGYYDQKRPASLTLSIVTWEPF